MRLLIYVDLLGIEKIELEHATPEERALSHKLYESLRAEIEKLNSVAQVAAAERVEGSE
jgi:hypothetical protein